MSDGRGIIDPRNSKSGGGVDPRLAHFLDDPRRDRLAEKDAATAEQERKAKEYSEGSLKKFSFKPENCLKVCVPLSNRVFYSYDSRDPEAIEGYLCPGPSNMGLHFPNAFEVMDAAPVDLAYIPYNGKYVAIHTMLDIIGTGVIWEIVKKPVWWPKPEKK